MQQKWINAIKQFFFRWRIPRSIPGIAVFVLIAALVIINLVALVFYTNYSKYKQDVASTDEIISQLLNTIYLMQVSPESKWETIVKISQTPEVKMSIKETPIFDQHIEKQKVGDLRMQSQHGSDHFAISIFLKKNTWLNVDYQSKSTAELMQVFIVTLAVVVAFALLFSAWTLVRFTRPLREFKRAAEQLGVGLGNNLIIEYGPAIVKETAFAMDQLQQRIQNLLKDKNQMLAAISHDLRSPITRLKLRVQLTHDLEQASEWERDLNEMEVMIDQILAYTNDLARTEDLVDLDLAALVLTVSDEYAELGYSIICHTTEIRLACRGYSLALKRAFNNIINNAITYGQSASVFIKSHNNQAIITVVDDGPGIPEDSLTKVFNAFYRVDHARSSDKRGTGLGLSIAQDIIHAHKGIIELKNNPELGLTVKVVLPLL